MADPTPKNPAEQSGTYKEPPPAFLEAPKAPDPQPFVIKKSIGGSGSKLP